MKRGFMLLEVVVAVGILVMGLAFVGMQVQNAANASRRSERALRALLLAESKLAELDTGLIEPADEIEDEFGPLFPDYGWRLRIETHPTTPDLNQITLDILYQARQDVEEEFDFEKAELVHRLYTLRVTPLTLQDVLAYFELSEEQEELVRELVNPDGEGLNPNELPARLPDIPLADLLEQAPQLLQLFGLTEAIVMQMLPEATRQKVEALQSDSENSSSADEGAGEDVQEPVRPGRRQPRQRDMDRDSESKGGRNSGRDVPKRGGGRR